MSEAENAAETILRRSLFLAGQLDTTGKVVDEILAKGPSGSPANYDERTRLAIGRVGELIGELEGNVVAVTPGPVIITAVDLP